MVGKGFQLLLFVVVFGCSANAFIPSPSSAKVRNQLNEESTSLMATRRSFVRKIVGSTIAVATVASPLEKAVASGGATAGGAYLLSAKQRYNDRVKQGVEGFLSLGPKLQAEDINAVRAFFTSEDAGMWKDFSAAGYLLSNAFRTTSSAPPDSLPSVKVSVNMTCLCIIVDCDNT